MHSFFDFVQFWSSFLGRYASFGSAGVGSNNW